MSAGTGVARSAMKEQRGLLATRMLLPSSVRYRMPLMEEAVAVISPQVLPVLRITCTEIYLNIWYDNFDASACCTAACQTV